MKLPKKLRLEISTDDIQNGVKTHSNQCPIARALKRTVGANWTDVGGDIATFEVSDYRQVEWSFTYRLNSRASNFIEAFDGGEPVKPFVTILRRIEL